VDAAYAKIQHAEEYICHLESQLGIVDRWTEDSADYLWYKQEVYLQDYRVALDELERLVVQRLFELSKVNMTGTGTCLFL
jgi:hypothetical protein